MMTPTAQTATAEAVTREIITGTLQTDWKPNGKTPADCGDFAPIVTPFWEAWEMHGPDGARRILPAMLATYKDLAGILAGRDLATLPDKERAYKAADYADVLHSLGYHFRLNVCDDRIEVNGEPLSDVLEAVIRAKLRDYGLRFVNIARDAMIADAARNRYHPVRRYLEGLQWDEHDHIAALSDHFQDRYTMFPVFLKRWLVGAIAKAYDAAQNRVLVLDGVQGIGKSHFVRWLASPLPDLYIEAPIDPSNKDDLIRLMRCWLWEVAELGSTTRKADAEALKHFLTQRQVTIRVPYGHNDLVKPALSSFIGTVNNAGGILNDPTGNRRFMVSNITALDWSYTALDPNQVWAQAFTLYRHGEPWELTGQEAQDATAINADYEIEDPLTDLLITRFEIDAAQPSWVTPTYAILDRLHGAGWRLSSPIGEARALAAACKRLGLGDPATIYDPTTSKKVKGYKGIK